MQSILFFERVLIIFVAKYEKENENKLPLSSLAQNFSVKLNVGSRYSFVAGQNYNLKARFTKRCLLLCLGRRKVMAFKSLKPRSNGA